MKNIRRIGLDEFCKEVAKVTNGSDTEWYQTNENAFPMDPIVDIDKDFPTKQSEVENFFYITGLDKGKQGNYYIRMEAATTERPLEIKKRMQRYLIHHNMFITDPEIENCTWNVVGIFYGMSKDHQYRPKYENILNTEIKNIIGGTSNLIEMKI